MTRQSLMLASLLLAALLSLLTAPPPTSADEVSQTYTTGEEVIVWYNKIGPYHNPQETYEYYSLPFCHPDSNHHKKKLHESDSTLGVILEGDELTDSGILLKFREDQDNTVLCTQEIDAESAVILTDAVQQHYWYQIYMDELPVLGMVGEYMAAEVAAHSSEHLQSASSHSHTKVQQQGFLYTHKEFIIAYNGNQVIEVNLTSENPKPITAGASYPITFSVQWVPTTKEFDTRFDRYLDIDFFEHQIHWFSIFNSFMMVVFLCGLVALILMRTLRADYARYSTEDEDLEAVVDESGWKQIANDVFRAPVFLSLYAAMIGTGTQLAALAVGAIAITLTFTLYDDRGSLSSALVALYSLTSVVAGYSSAYIYKRNGGLRWKNAMILTALLPLTALSAVGLPLNLIATAYSSTSALSIWTMLYIFLIWLFVSCPLILLGTIYGRNKAVIGDFPCRVNPLKRPIPLKPWYTTTTMLSLLTGILPFGSIFIEIYFIFTSFWNYKFYYVYGFGMLVFCILTVVVLCVTVVSTYILLNSEDHRWHWNAFTSAASISLYIYLYAIYYFYTKTKMQGLLQTSFYFGYMILISIGVGCMCGAIGAIGAHLFVQRIYKNIKSD